MGLQQTIQLILDDASRRAYEAAMRDAGRAGGEALAGGTQTAAETGFGKLETYITGFFKGLAATVATYFTARAVVRFAEDSVAAFAQAERAAYAYTTAAQRVGAAQQRIVEDLARFRALAGKTPFVEEDISRAAEQLVVTLGDEQKAMEVLPLALDLAARRHVDLATAANALGYALKTGSVDALRRFKIAIQEGQPILATLRSQVQGAAEDLSPLDRGTRALASQWTQFKEAVGKALSEAGGGVSTLDTITGVVKVLTEKVKDNADTWGSWGKAVTKAIGEVVSALVDLPKWPEAGKQAGRSMVSNFLDAWKEAGHRMQETLYRALEASYRDAGKIREANIFKQMADDAKRLGDQLERVQRGRSGLLRDVAGGRAGPSPEDLQADYDKLVAAQRAKRKGGAVTGAAGGFDVIAGLDPAKLAQQQQFLAALQENVAKLWQTEADQAQAALDKMRAQAEELFLHNVPADVKAMFAQLQTAVEQTRVFQGLDLELATVEDRAAAVGDKTAAAIQDHISALDELVVRYNQEIAKLPEGSTRRLAIEAKVLELYKERNALVPTMAEAQDRETRSVSEEADDQGKLLSSTQDQIRALKEKLRLQKESGAPLAEQKATQLEISRLANQQLDHVRSVVSSLRDAVQGALQLGQAFGIVSEETAKILNSVAQIAGSTINLVASIQAGNLGGIISGGVSILGGIASLFGGESPEDKARREALEKNNDRLQELRLAVERLTLTMTGAEASRIAQALRAAIPTAQEVGGKVGTPWLKQFLGQRGISWAQFLKGASDLGITLTPEEGITVEQLQAYQLALPTTAGGQYGTWSQQKEALDLRLKALGETRQYAQLQAYAQLAATNAPGLFGGLANLDLSTAAGRDQLLKLLGGTAQRLGAGTGIPLAELGGLSEMDLRQIIADFMEAAQNINEATADQAKQAQADQLASLTAEQQAAVTKRAAEEERTALYQTLADAMKLGGTVQVAAQTAVEAYTAYLAQAAGPLGPEGPLARDLYARFQDAFRAAQAAVGAGMPTVSTVGYGVQQTFTVAQGDVVAGELREANIHLQELVALARLATGRAMTIGTLVIEVPGGITDPRAWAEAAAEEFDAALGGRYQDAALVSGNPTIQ